MDRFADDAAELTAYLRTKYHKRKIIVIGHSWGSYIGVRLAQRHPEWLYAYVGIGQVVNMRQSERMGYETTLQMARADKNAGAIRDLEAIAPYPGAAGPIDFSKTMKERKWLVHYGGYTWNNTNDHYDDILKLSPDYTDADVKAYEAGDDASPRVMWAQLSEIDFRHQNVFRCPVVLFEGSHDLNTNHELLRRWYATIQAPSKKLVWFSNSSHMVMMEEPGKMLVHLVQDVRPYAAQAGDVAPE